MLVQERQLKKVRTLSRKHFRNGSMPSVVISTNTISAGSAILGLGSVPQPPPLSTPSPWSPLLPSPLPSSLVTYQVSNKLRPLEISTGYNKGDWKRTAEKGTCFE